MTRNDSRLPAATPVEATRVHASQTTQTVEAPKRRSWKKILALAVPCVALLVLLGISVFTWYVTAAPEAHPAVIALQDNTTNPGLPDQPQGADGLRVMTLNIAHGRSTSFNQMLLRKREIKSNLSRIASMLKREGPLVVALQEADGASLWSGDFSHVEYLGKDAGYRWLVRGEHVNGLGLSYGTALLAMTPMTHSLAVTFKPSPPTPAKGFVVSTIRWPGRALDVDVVAVHLDFLRSSVRRDQVQALVAELAPRKRPLIIMGDFNCQWTDKEATLPTLAKALRVRPHKPEACNLTTFPTLGKRLDWILISEDLEFVTYTVLPDTVSDHRGMVADLGIRRPSRRDVER